MKLIFSLIVLENICVIHCWPGRSPGKLSTFRLDAFNFRTPEGCNSTLDEVIWYMQSYFMFRHRYTDTEWASMKRELSHYKDVHLAITSFLERLGDPYSRYIPEGVMAARMRNTKGETIGIGVHLRRRIYLLEVGENIHQRAVTLAKMFSLQATKTRFKNFRTMYKGVHNNDNNENIFRKTLGQIRIREIYKRVFNKILFFQSPRRRLTHSLSSTSNHSSILSPELSKPLPSSSETESERPEDWSYEGLNEVSWPSKISMLAEFSAPLIWACAVIPIVGTPWRPAVGVTGLIWSGKTIIQHFAPIEVTFVSPGSPSSAAGIIPGDKILTVGGNHVWRMSIKRLQALLDDGPLGEEIRLSLKRRTVNINKNLNEKIPIKMKSVGSMTNLPTSTSIARPTSKSSRWRSSRSTSTSGSSSTTDMIQNDNIISSKPQSNNSVLFEVKLIRDYMPLSAVSSRILSSGLGYISISEFTDRTAVDVSECLQTLRSKMISKFGKCMDALVLDLRGNAGGTVGSALDVASLFLTKNKVVIQMLNQGRTETHISLNPRPDLTTELLLLVDGRTASASEMLVAALRDHHRATTMGSTTVGKDVAQALLWLSDGSGLTCSVRSYLSPMGRPLRGGIEPDYPVTPSCIVPDQLRWDDGDRSWKFLK